MKMLLIGKPYIYIKVSLKKNDTIKPLQTQVLTKLKIVPKQ